MRQWFRKLFARLYAPIALWLISKDRSWNYNGMRFIVPKGVFHPGLFFSSKFLLSELLLENLKGVKLLEIGSGSGFISVVAATKGAVVTAIDLNHKAVLTTEENAKSNGQSIEVLESDLFSKLVDRKFELMVVNPPYFRGQPATEADRAWFAGEELQYFQVLFSAVASHFQVNAKMLMVLSEDCEVKEIRSIAERNGLRMQLQRTRNFWVEKNYVFAITSQ